VVPEVQQKSVEAAKPAPPPSQAPVQENPGDIKVNTEGAKPYEAGMSCHVMSDPYAEDEQEVGERNPTDAKPFYQDRRSILVMIICCCCCLIAGVILITSGIRDEQRTPGNCFKYQKMATGASAQCTTGTGLSTVGIEADCRAAANYLGLPMGEPFISDREFCDRRPVGCYYADTKDKVFFNDCNGHVAPSDTTRQIICKGLAEPYEKACEHTHEGDINKTGVAGIVLLSLMCLPCFGLIVVFICMSDACLEGKKHGGMHSGWRGGGSGGCGGCGGGAPDVVEA